MYAFCMFYLYVSLGYSVQKIDAKIVSYSQLQNGIAYTCGIQEILMDS